MKSNLKLCLQGKKNNPYFVIVQFIHYMFAY